MVSRRSVIAGGTGAAVLTALGYRALDRGALRFGKDPAYAAWDEAAGRPGEGSTRPLHAAVLAASAHNTQPWAFEPQDDSITVYADLSRHLGAADPFRRELHISLGCALYNLGIGASHSPEVPLPEIEDQALSPNPPPRLVRLCEQRLLTRESWAHEDRRQELAALAVRHTHRGAYLKDRPLPPDFAKTYGFASFISDPGAMEEMGALIIEATERFIADPEMSRDSGRWMRTGRREIEAKRDGVTVDTAGLSPAITTLAKLLPDQDTASTDAYWLKSTRQVQVPTAAAFGVFFSTNRLSRLDAIAAGANWQMLHLAATMAGLSVQPMNAPVEMMDRDFLLGRRNPYARSIAKLAAPNGTGEAADDIAFIFRIGYADKPAPASPRRRFTDILHQKGFA